jgi:hypothetical protein
MPTDAQLRANRLNATKSTGPRTPAGKDTCRRNSLKHGLTADKLLLTIEDQPAFEATRAQLIEDYAPATELESMLVEEIAQNWFRLQRARAWEREVLEKALNGFFPTDPFNRAMRYLAAAERAWHRSINQLRAVQKERRTMQPQEAEVLNPIGSVSQNNSQRQPVPPAAPPLAPPAGSVPQFHVEIPSIEALNRLTLPDQEPHPTNGSL